jgi:ribosomal protein L37AE/L43A
MPSGFTGVLTKTKVLCPRCGAKEMARVSRQGFWQERVLPMFGRYPWQCAICGEERVLRRRGAVIRKAERKRSELEEAAQEGSVAVVTISSGRTSRKQA